MSGTIYSHIVENGIKIGWSTNYAQRRKQYASSGETIKPIKIINKAKKECDQIIKNTLIQLNRNVKIKDQSSTEVYNISKEQVIEMLTYIERHEGTITENIIEKIINAKTHITILTMTLKEFKEKINTTYKKFKFQRDTDEEHADNIKKFIEDKYLDDEFYLSPIVVARNKNNTYDVVDGMHRIHAIGELDDNDPCLNMLITIHQNEIVLSEQQKLLLFCNLNKAKAMAEIYIISKI